MIVGCVYIHISNLFSAGIRVGYAGMPLWIMTYMWRVKQPYNVSAVAEVAACAALDNAEYLKVKIMLCSVCIHSHPNV